MKGYNFREQGGTSWANLAEVNVVIHYIFKLVQMIKTSDIGVISPYTHQTRLIWQKLNRCNIPKSNKITVDSVERFQGSERRAIIITGTRTSKNQLGFMADDLVGFYGFCLVFGLKHFNVKVCCRNVGC